MSFWLGVWFGFHVGFFTAIAFDHWITMLYEPKELDTPEHADAYVRAQPHWPKDRGP